MVRQLPPDLRQLARAQRGVLLGNQMFGSVGRRVTQGLITSGAVVKLWHGAYALPGVEKDVRSRLFAAELTLDKPIVACLQTAAELYGFDLDTDCQTHIMAGHNWSNATGGIHQHRYRRAAADASSDGYRVTDLAETVVRMACRETDPAKVLAVLDRALFKTGVDRLDLVCVADSLHIRGIGLTRELIPLADGRAESPGESWLRWVFIEAGLPTAEPQIWVTDVDGTRHRIDLGWRERRIGCEYEGEEHHTKDALTRDRTRYNTLGRQQWLMHGVTSPMIWITRRTLISNVQSLLDQRPA
jgi:hypothetical protein